MVIENEVGIWHTKCFPKSSSVNDLKLKIILLDICSQLYGTANNVEWRRLGLTYDFNYTHYQQPLTKVTWPEQPSSKNGFSVGYPEPFKQQWNSTDMRICDPIEIKCT